MKIASTKITATPTPHTWSQAYSAGNFSALIALSEKNVTSEAKGEKTLQEIGRDVATTLESEYFTIENKNLASIKQVVSKAVANIPENVHANLIVTTVIDKALYACIAGGGKIFLKREGEMGLLLEKTTHAIEEEHTRKVESVSGFVKLEDIIFLMSDAFLDLFSEKELLAKTSTETPEQIAEAVMPHLHRKKEGDACAIIISIAEEKPVLEIRENLDSLNAGEPKESVSETHSIRKNLLPHLPSLPKFKLPHFHKRAVFLIVAFLLIILLAGSIATTVQKQKAQKLHAQFENAYASAQKKYDEGQNLLSLNKTDAKNDFSAARSLITPYQNSYTQTTPEGKQIADFLGKIDVGLKAASAENTATSLPVDEKNSPLLATEIKNSSDNYFAQDDTTVYFVDSDKVTSVDKKTQSSKTIIKNGNSWSDVGGFGTYLRNMYVLDRKNDILKFVAGSGGFGKNSYFGNTNVDLTKAASMTIDGSVYVLFSDGGIKKFTRGKPDDFSLSGLQKPLKNPTRIFTTADENNLYILDNGNGRIVVLNKSGSYQAQYQSDVLSKAKDFEVLEKDKKIYVLTDGKVYEVNIK